MIRYIANEKSRNQVSHTIILLTLVRLLYPAGTGISSPTYSLKLWAKISVVDSGLPTLASGVALY